MSGSDSLQLDVSNLLSSFSRNSDVDCGVIVRERAICDRSWVPFMGLQRGDYKFVLKDTVIPVVEMFSPENGNTASGLHPHIVLVFNEGVRLGADSLRGSLSRMRPDGSSTAEHIASFSIGPPYVVVDTLNTHVRIDISQFVQPNAMYSLALPPGAFVDFADNQFPGLSLQEYIFRTAPPPSSGVLDSVTGGPSVGLIVGVVLGMVVIIVFGILVGVKLMGASDHQPRYLKAVRPIGAVFERPSLVKTTPVMAHQVDSGRCGSKQFHGSSSVDPSTSQTHDPVWEDPSGAWASARSQASTVGGAARKPPADAQAHWRTTIDNRGQQVRQSSTQYANAKPTSSSYKSHANKTEAPSAPGARHSSNNADGQSHSAGRSEAPVPRAFSAESNPHVKAVEQRMRNMLGLSSAERKKALRDLLVEFHPDKNNDAHAKEVFQYVNNARSWFLFEPKT